MDFSVTVKKWFVQVEISGAVQVTDAWVILDGELPPLVSSLMSEEKVTSEFDTHFARLFPT